MSDGFPKDPVDGMIFESSPGSFYQFNAALNSWRVVSAPNIPVATLANDGLMPKEDFSKLTGLLIPPPETTITVDPDNCDPFDQGITRFVGDDIINIEPETENLHENTATINFDVDIDALAAEMQKRGSIRFTAPQGDRGKQGDGGEDGADSLPTGPQGADGNDGVNAAWPGSLTQEQFQVAQDDRAIVDIDTEEISPQENYLVIKRSNIGNPDACPDSVIPQDVQSPWLMAFDNTCACNTPIFYFDVDVLIEGVRNHWIDYLNSVKAEKEALASSWLNAIIGAFNDQKSSLCCALDACKSRSRNEGTRRFIESQRIAAAVGDFKLIIGGNDDKIFPPSDPELGSCGWNIAPTNFNLSKLSDPDCTIDWPTICPQ